MEQKYLETVTEAIEGAIALSGEPILPFFRFAHLPEKLQAVSARFADVAAWLTLNQNKSAERTVALRKLLEGKDAAVRNAL